MLTEKVLKVNPVSIYYLLSNIYYLQKESRLEAQLTQLPFTQPADRRGRLEKV